MGGVGISRLGGKCRLVKQLLQYIPARYEFFLSLFCGACWFELNIPRAMRYEMWNDKDGELINYLSVIKEKYKEYHDRLEEKQIYYLYSQELFRKILTGELKPKDDIDRAIFFRYINKCSRPGCNLNYSDVTVKYYNINMKTTRLYTNNDKGLTKKIKPEIIERMKYVVHTSLPFQKAYEKFSSVLEKNDIIDSVFIYIDPPYYKKERIYTFTEDDVDDLIELIKSSPYKIMLSINDCDRYRVSLNNFNIYTVTANYQICSYHQIKRKELLILNYKPSKNQKQELKQKKMF